MDFFNTNNPIQSGTLHDSPREINERLKRRYLDRLNQRVKKLRRLIVDRNWEELRSECYQLANTGENFGFPQLTLLAAHAYQVIPQGKISRASTPYQAKESVETLINAIDSTLIDHTVFRA